VASFSPLSLTDHPEKNQIGVDLRRRTVGGDLELAAGAVLAAVESGQRDRPPVTHVPA
jgi:hypothetical protein